MVNTKSMPDLLKEEQNKKRIAFINKYAESIDSTKSKKQIKQCIAIMANLLISSNNLNVSKLKKLYAGYASDTLDIAEYAEFSARDVVFTKEDLIQQYRIERNSSTEEDCANIMYLANQLAHKFAISKDYKFNAVGENENSEEIKTLKKELYVACKKIKDFYIKQLISLKANGFNIEISLYKDETRKRNDSYNSIIAFTLPSYFEPFVVHVNNKDISKEERKNCQDLKSLVGSDYLPTIFPLKLSKEKEKALQQIWNEKYMNGHFYGSENGTLKREKRLECFIEAQGRLKNDKLNNKNDDKDRD